MKDTIFFTGNADLIFLGSNLYPFFVRLPVTNAWNWHSLYTGQHSQAMLERGVCELAHSFFFMNVTEVIAYRVFNNSLASNGNITTPYT